MYPTEDDGEDEVDFCPFNTPLPARSGRVPLTAGQAADLLLQRVKEAKRQVKKSERMYYDAVSDLVMFYGQNGRAEDGRRHLETLLRDARDPERRAALLLLLGDLAYEEHDIEMALNHYFAALMLEPVSRRVWYFVNNNIGRCLNQCGRYLEAEKYCRIAIRVAIYPRHAFRNLGIALMKQGKYVEAAQYLIWAYRGHVRDDHAYLYLSVMVNDHPEVSAAFPHLIAELKAVQARWAARP